MDSTLEKYIELFKKINVSHRQGMKAPHKAVLLLTVMSLIESGEQTDRFIEFTDTLRERFRDIWSQYIGDSRFFNPEVAMPFWHLKNEVQLWKLIPVNDKAETILGLSRSPLGSSLLSIRRFVKCAEIPEDLFRLLLDPLARATLSEILFEYYIYA